MRHVMLVAAALIMIITSFPSLAADSSGAKEMYPFLSGSYAIVGRHPDSERSYTGTTTITFRGNVIRFRRMIDGKTFTGKASIRTPTCCKSVRMLELTWKEKGEKTRAALIIRTDLDNYGRLTGYVWHPGTRSPGLEAWFASEPLKPADIKAQNP